MSCSVSCSVCNRSKSPLKNDICQRNNTLHYTLQQNGSNGTRRLCLFKFACRHTSTFALCLSPPIPPLHHPLQIPSVSLTHNFALLPGLALSLPQPPSTHPIIFLLLFTHTHTQILLSYFTGIHSTYCRPRVGDKDTYTWTHMPDLGCL